MDKNFKNKGRALSIPAGLTYAAAICIGLTIIFSGLTAWAIERSVLPMEKSGYAVMFILYFVTVIGGITSAKKIKHQILAVCIGSGIIYFGILLSITALFFGGKYCAVGETSIVIAVGSATAAIICLSKKTKSRSKG